MCVPHLAFESICKRHVTSKSKEKVHEVHIDQLWQ